MVNSKVLYKTLFFFSESPAETLAISFVIEKDVFAQYRSVTIYSPHN